MNLPVSSQAAPAEGFSLVEVLIAITVLGALVAIAVPSFNRYKDQQKVSLGIADLRVLDNRLKSHKLRTESFPAALSELIGPNPNDPWGRPYDYFKIEGAGIASKGKVRMDKNLVPINSDFDLYSKGKDGASTLPLTDQNSLDDVVRANDGAFYGMASKY